MFLAAACTGTPDSDFPLTELALGIALFARLAWPTSLIGAP